MPIIQSLASLAPGFILSNFAMQDNVASLRTDFSCACVSTTTNLAAEATAGNDYIDLVDASSYGVGHGIAIPGAGVAGAEKLTYVVSRVANRLNLGAVLDTTVAAGGIIYHDDTVNLKAALNDSRGLRLWNPGDIMTTSRVDFQKMGNIIFGSDFMLSEFYPFNEGEGSSIILRFDTDHGLFLGSNRCGLVGLTIDQHASVPRTGGAAILNGPEYNGYTSYESTTVNGLHSSTLARLYINNPWIGIREANTWSSTTTDIEIENYLKNAMLVDRSSGFGQTKFRNLNVSGAGPTNNSLYASVEAAYKITATDLNQWQFVNCWRVPCGLNVKTRSGEHVANQIVSTLGVDNLIGAGTTPRDGYGVTIEQDAGAVTTFNVVVKGATVNQSSTGYATYYVGTGCSNNVLDLVRGRTDLGPWPNVDNGTNTVIRDCY